MPDPKNNTVQSSEQQTLPTTASYNNYLYSAPNNFPVDSNSGPYGVMPYSIYPLNQWQPADDFQHVSNITGNLTTTASSDMASTSSTVTNNIPIMSINQVAAASSNLNMGPSCSSVVNTIPPFANKMFQKNPKFCFPMNELDNDVVTLSNCVLYPPNPLPTYSEIPPNCATVYVKGFPVEATVEMVNQIFDKYGILNTINLKKNTYVVKYYGKHNADEAVCLNGWKIKFENEDLKDCTGTLHVSHIDEDDISLQGFSNRDLSLLLNKLDDEDEFEKALYILINWLERGECTKRNGTNFYSAIQKTNKHVQKLMNIKANLEEEVHKAKQALTDKVVVLSSQMKEYEKVLESTRLQKVWDHLTKAQRKNIMNWTEEVATILSDFFKELLEDRVEDEMEMSDDEEIRSGSEDEGEETDELCKLRQEIQDLHNQLEFAEQEIREAQTEKEDSVKSLRHDIQDAFQVIKGNEKQVQFLKELLQRNSEIDECTQASGVQSSGRHSADNQSEDTELESVNLPLEITEYDTRLIGLIGTFLNSHPFGASLDYIASYLDSVDCSINARDAENVMKQMPSVFKEEIFGIGSSLKKRWKFLGFNI